MVAAGPACEITARPTPLALAEPPPPIMDRACCSPMMQAVSRPSHALTSAERHKGHPNQIGFQSKEVRTSEETGLSTARCPARTFSPCAKQTLGQTGRQTNRQTQLLPSTPTLKSLPKEGKGPTPLAVSGGCPGLQRLGDLTRDLNQVRTTAHQRTGAARV
jgi:hypothetical protein